MLLCTELEPGGDAGQGASPVVAGDGGLPPRHFLEDLALALLEGGEGPDPFAAHYLAYGGSEKTARRVRDLLAGKWARFEDEQLDLPGSRARLYALLETGGPGSAERYFLDRFVSESDPGKRREFLSLLFPLAGPETQSRLEPLIPREQDSAFRAALLCTASKFSHDDGRELELLRLLAKNDPSDMVRSEAARIFAAKIAGRQVRMSIASTEIILRSPRHTSPYLKTQEVSRILGLGNESGRSESPSAGHVRVISPSVDWRWAVLEPLEDLARTDPSEKVRLAAVSAIAVISHQKIIDIEEGRDLYERIVGDLEQAEADPCEDVRREAGEALQWIRWIRETLREAEGR